jgi:DNA invertase Pin-like site-specific DNA recombinase
MQRESGISLEEQRRKIEGRCIEQGWQLAGVFVDAAVSGTTPLAKRPEGARLHAVLNPGDIVIAAKMDRAFRSTLDALQTIQSFRNRKISLWLLDPGGDVSGNGIAELIMTVLAAVAQFERSLISERMVAAKAQMRHQGLLQGGKAPFGYKLGELAGHGRTRHLLPDPAQQEAIVTMRGCGKKAPR